MAVSPFPYRWGLAEFLGVWEAGGFDKRAELIDGEVWDVPVGLWHARTNGRVIRALPNGSVEVIAGSLPSGQSLPEPDCWVLRAGAVPLEQLSPRMQRWAAADVALVVEVSDETRDHDLTRKATLYAEAGFPAYWSVTREGIYAHSGPTPGGYTRRLLYRPGEHVPVPYDETVLLAVDDLLATPEA